MSPPKSIDRERWAKLSIFQQMGNIYSEVGRSLAAKKRGDSESMRLALIRALDLFDTTVEQQIEEKSPRVKEVLRARDQYLQLYSTSTPEPKELEKLDKYFLQFAVAARLHA